MKAILICILFTLACPAWVRAGFTVDDWHHVGVNAPYSDVGDGYWQTGYESLVIDNDGNPIVAGGFTYLANQSVSAVAKWNGTNWQAFGTGLDFFAMNQQRAFSVVSDGTNIYVSGEFRLSGEDSFRYLAWWDGNAWHYDNLHVSGFRPIGIRMLAAGNGVIYAVGDFRLPDNYLDIAQCIASWSPVLGWRNLGKVLYDSNVSGIPVTVIVTDGNDLYVAGDLTHIGGVAANRIAKWDGLSWSALGSGFDSRPEALVIHQGALIASGRFEQSDGSGIGNIARWNGHTWSEYAGGMPISLGMTPEGVYVRNFGRSMVSDGLRLWVGSDFSYLDGHPDNTLNYWNGNEWGRLPGGPATANDLQIFQNQLYCLEWGYGSKHVYRADLNALNRTFDFAATSAGLAGTDARPNAIPFHDGVPNLLKYAFNLNLAAADRRTMVPGGTAGLPHVSRVPGESPVFRIEYLRRLNAGLNHLPQTSSSLEADDWEPVPGTPQRITIDTSWERVIHEVPATAGRMFGRVGVELGE